MARRRRMAGWLLVAALVSTGLSAPGARGAFVVATAAPGAYKGKRIRAKVTFSSPRMVPLTTWTPRSAKVR